MEKATPAPEARPRPNYHHGNLRAAMIAATIALIEEVGEDRVTVREAARRAGVSSGAPFRHFASRKALMTAVAEDAMHKLRTEIEGRLEGSADACPITRLLAMADGYILWAVENPTHYRIVGNRPLVDFYQSDMLVGDNRWIRKAMAACFNAAQGQGMLRPCDISLVSFQSRAMAYGLARMYVDAHFREFGIAATEARQAMSNALREFILGLATDDVQTRVRATVAAGTGG